jgi:hypothetical protein
MSCTIEASSSILTSLAFSFLKICLDCGPKTAFPMNHEASLSHALTAPGLQTCLALPAALGLDKPAIIPTAPLYSQCEGSIKHEVLSTVVNGTES